MPLATVVLLSRNYEPYVAEAIESALGQTVSDIELLIIDNGSTDGSPDVIRRYENDPRVRTFMYDENAPVTRRLNEGTAAATSEFLSFLYSDDTLLPDKLERQLEAFALLPDDYGVVYGPTMGLNQLTGRRWTYGSLTASGWVFDALMEDHFAGQIQMPSPLIRRGCLLRHQWNEDIFGECEAIFYRIALTHRFHFLETPGAVMRDHGDNAGKATRQNAEMTLVALDRLESHPDLPEGSKDKVNRFRARLLRAYAWQGARLGEDPRWIRRCVAEAVRVRPSVVTSWRTVAALVLSSLPAVARSPINRAGHRIKDNPGNSVLANSSRWPTHW